MDEVMGLSSFLCHVAMTTELVTWYAVQWASHTSGTPDMAYLKSLFIITLSASSLPQWTHLSCSYKLCVCVTVLLQAVCWLWEGSTSAWLHSDVAVFCLPPGHFGRSLQGPQCGCGDSHIPAGWNSNADCRKGNYMVQMWQLWILKESKGTRETETH